MKKSIIALAVVAAGALNSVFADTPVVYPGEAINSISPNGEWMVSELDLERSMLIRHIPSGKIWTYIYNGLDGGTDYLMAMTGGVSDDGTVVAVVGSVPSYWRDGKWKAFPGSTGGVAILGAITPDGKTVAGSINRQGGVIGTSPCIWRKTDDGSFSEPEFLPSPGRDILGGSAQFLNATALSDDGSVIGVSMRSGNGFFHIPYVYRRNDKGGWESLRLGYELMNPEGRNVSSPGNYRGPSWPDYFSYIDPDRLEEFLDYCGPWSDELMAQGKKDWEVSLLQLSMVMDFMTPEKKAKYEPILNSFLDAYMPWLEKQLEYEAFLQYLTLEGLNFEFNNVFVSPDGKYLFATAVKTILLDPGNPENGVLTKYAPVRFDTATGEYELCSFDDNVLISSVAADYSILGWEYDPDVYLYRQAYIYPQNSSECVSLPDFYRNEGNGEAYRWFEENLYQEVLTGVSENGAYMYDDAWSTGKPVATPDLSYIGFAVSTLYWNVPPNPDAIFHSYLLDTVNPFAEEGNSNEDNAVESFGDAAISLTPLKGGALMLSGDVVSVSIYDIAGNLVYHADGPGSYLDTSLPAGVYVVSAVGASGERLTKKAIF